MSVYDLKDNLWSKLKAHRAWQEKQKCPEIWSSPMSQALKILLRGSTWASCGWRGFKGWWLPESQICKTYQTNAEQYRSREILAPFVFIVNCKSGHELEISKKRKSTRQCKGFWVYPRSNFLLIDRGSIYAIEVSSEHCNTSSLQKYFIEITAEIGRQGQDCNQAQTYSFNHRAGIEYEPQVDLTLVEENGSDIESATRLTRKVELFGSCGNWRAQSS